MLRLNPDMLLYIGMADVYALAAEYVDYGKHEVFVASMLNFERYLPHPSRPLNPVGAYSDDCEMSIANAKLLLKGPPYTKLQFAQAWVDEFALGGRRKGYSKKFQTLLEEVNSGEEFLEKVTPTSDRNGACMRAVPFGVIKDVNYLVDLTSFQASVTHNTFCAIFSAKVVSLLSHFSLYKPEAIKYSGEFCLDYLTSKEKETYGYIFKEPWSGRVTNETIPVSITTVHAVYHLLNTRNSLLDIMRGVIELGGDTDSVAAVAWGIASPYYLSENLPGFLQFDLEKNQKTDASYLRSIGSQLMLKYGAKS